MKLRWRDCTRPMLALGVAACALPASAGSCSVTTSGLAFGSYEPVTVAGRIASADRTSTAVVTLDCSLIVIGGSYTIALGASPANGSIASRQMANARGGPGMLFNVYADPAHTIVWGNGVIGAVLRGSIPGAVGGLNSTRTHTVYGRVPAGQSTLRAGTYSSSLPITVIYNP